MYQVIALFFLRTILCTLLYGLLIAAIHNKTKVWRFGIMAGFAINGCSAIAYLIPDLRDYADLVGLFGNTAMIALVFLSYFKAGPPPNEERKTRLLKEMSIGLLASFAGAAFVAYSVGRQNEMRVQEGLAGVVYTLSNEVRDLRKSVNRLGDRVSAMERDTVFVRVPAKQPVKPKK